MQCQPAPAPLILQRLIKQFLANELGTDPTPSALVPLAKQASHQFCAICSNHALLGLKLNFYQGDNCVWASTQGNQHQQGYQGILHGGLLAALVDATMCQTLFSLDIEAVTAEMNVRYLRPVPVGSEILMQGSLIGSHGPLFQVQANLIVDNQLVVKAKAKFFKTKAKA